MTTNIAFSAPIKKTARGLAFVEVYIPMVPDSQGDITTAETLERTAHDFNVSSRADQVDTEHDGKKTGSLVVESFIARTGDPDFTAGAWVVGMRPDPLTMAKIDRGEIVGVSFAGSAAETVPTVLDGKNVRELRGVIAKAISWTARPANRPQGAKMVVKSDALLAAVHALIAKVDTLAEQTGELAKRADGLNGERSSTVRKSAIVAKAEAERAIKAQELRARRAAYAAKWEQHAERPSFDAAAREQYLLREIEKCDLEIAALEPEPSPFENPGTSAFAFRGGQSIHIDAGQIFPGNDSAFVREDRVRKTGGVISLNCLKI